jgi:hypothetical protein
MLEVGALLLFAIPIIVWVILHGRAGKSIDDDSTNARGPKHRWWQP